MSIDMRAFLITVFFGLACAEVPSQFAGVIASTTQIAEQCKEQTNATEDIHQLINTFTLPTTPEGKCMVACVMKNMSLMKDDKVDNKAVDNYLGKMVPPGFLPVAQMYLNQCHSSGGSSGKDACENAFAFAACARNVMKVNFPMFLPAGASRST